MLYGTLIVYKRIWLKLNSSEPRHRLCLPGHQGRCENGRTFNSHTLWILDSTASRSVWIDVRYHARHCGTPQRSRSSVFYCLCWWNRNTSLVAVHDGGFRQAQKLLEWVSFFFKNSVYPWSHILAKEIFFATVNLDGLCGEDWWSTIFLTAYVSKIGGTFRYGTGKRCFFQRSIFFFSFWIG